MSHTPAINTQDDPSDSQENWFQFLFGLVCLLVSPISIITAVGVYLTFSYGKIKRSVIAVFTSPLFIIPLFFLNAAWNSMVHSWFQTLPSVFSDPSKIFVMLGEQFPIAAPVGVLVGLGFASWKWFTRARWQEWKFKRTPWEIYARKRTIQQIRNDEGTPTDGMTLGVDMESPKRVVQTYGEASGQTFLVGGSGSGKTRTALTRIRDQIKNGDAVCVVDLKADPEVANIIKIYCDRYGRKMQHFTLQDIHTPYTGPAEDGPAHYDPLAQGDATRRTDMVLDLRDWTNADFYKKMTQAYLQLLFTVHIYNPPKEGVSALQDAIALMNPKYLQERARPLAADPHFTSFVASIDVLNDERMSSSVRENLQTNRSQLEIFLQGIAGPWLTYDKGGNNISLMDTALKGEVVVFSLDSQAYPSLAADIANLIIQDLKTVSSALLQVKNNRPFHVFIDEFSAIGSENIVGLINKARASNMYVTIATQTLGDLVVKNPALRMQIMGIISSFIIHRANTEEDAQVYAGLTGTTTVSRVRQSVDYSQNRFGGIGSGIGTGNASVEEVEQWKVMPDEIQHLSVGQMFYINSQTHRIKKVQCIIEDIADPEKGGSANALTSGHTFHTDEPRQGEMVQEALSLEKPEVPSLAELTGTTVKAPAAERVNQQLTAESFQTPEPKKASNTMFGNKKSPKGNEAASTKKDHISAKEAFEEIKDMEKVPLPYDLLRTFFNDPKIVDEQEREDIADGVVPDTHHEVQHVPAPVVKPKAAPAAPKAPASTSPFAPKQQSGGRLPSRPAFPTRPQKPSAPAKSEFDF